MQIQLVHTHRHTQSKFENQIRKCAGKQWKRNQNWSLRTDSQFSLRLEFQICVQSMEGLCATPPKTTIKVNDIDKLKMLVIGVSGLRQTWSNSVSEHCVPSQPLGSIFSPLVTQFSISQLLFLRTGLFGLLGLVSLKCQSQVPVELAFITHILYLVHSMVRMLSCGRSLRVSCKCQNTNANCLLFW